jgi:Restriction endonuclease BsobI
MAKPYRDHLKNAADLRTTPVAIRAGFVALALEKNRRATPHVAEARALMFAASKAKKPTDLLAISEIQPALLAAAGVSDKASKHLKAADKDAAIAGLIEEFLTPAGDKFAEELTFRFLLTRGDTLGGTMRNVGGFLAQCLLTRAIVANLRLAGTSYRWLPRDSSTWIAMPEDDAGVELQARGLAWGVSSAARTLVYNLTVPMVGNNVDLCLFNCTPEKLSKETQKQGSAYLGLGELKGGIDPAGADEHWKTARTALTRIREAFAAQKLNPHTFFIGAAIEAKMAAEIWQMLKTGVLENAANLTDETQRASFTNWLCRL